MHEELRKLLSFYKLRVKEALGELRALVRELRHAPDPHDMDLRSKMFSVISHYKQDYEAYRMLKDMIAFSDR